MKILVKAKKNLLYFCAFEKKNRNKKKRTKIELSNGETTQVGLFTKQC